MKFILYDCNPMMKILMLCTITLTPFQGIIENDLIDLEITSFDCKYIFFYFEITKIYFVLNQYQNVLQKTHGHKEYRL
jgi:hypothetical protein